MSKHIMIIANPVSGKGAVKEHLFDAVDELTKGGYICDVYLTKASGDATILAGEYGAQYETCVVIGGDGTLSEVAAGLIKLQNPPKVGYIPLGTTNDVAKTFGLPLDIRKGARNVIDGEPVDWDVGIFDGKVFSYVAAFGAFTESSYSTSQSLKKLLGHTAYVVEGISSIPKIKAYHTVIEYDGGTVEGDFLYGGASNSLSIGGIVKLNPDIVGMGDGVFECIFIRKPEKISDLGKILNSVLSQNYNEKEVVFFQTNKLHFHFDEPVAFTRDGESGGSFTDVEAENMHAALKLIVPKNGGGK